MSNSNNDSTKLTRSEAGRLGGLASRKAVFDKRDQRVCAYLKSPRHCQQCGESLPYSKRGNKYCSRSCAASTNGKVFPKRKKVLTEKACLLCGKITKNPKFCSNHCSAKFQKQTTAEMVETNQKVGAKSLRNYLLELRGHQCEQCLNTLWNCEKIPLEVDHINGDSQNNRLDNLRLLCPNCHAQTTTYKSKNRGKGRYDRKVRYQEGKSY